MNRIRKEQATFLDFRIREVGLKHLYVTTGKLGGMQGRGLDILTA